MYDVNMVLIPKYSDFNFNKRVAKLKNMYLGTVKYINYLHRCIYDYE